VKIMPPVKKPRKSTNATSRNQYTAELSSSQLVLGISILMIFGLACFLFGVVIGKTDPSIDGRLARNVETPEKLVSEPADPPAKTKPPVKSETATKKTVNETPKPSTKSPVIEEKTIVVPQKTVEKPVKPATQVPQSATVETTDLQPDTPATTNPTTPDAPEITRPKVEVPANTPTNAVQIAAVDTQPTVKQPSPVATPVNPTPPTGTGWYVQIAASRQRSNAEAEAARLQSKIPYTIDVYKPEGSVWTKLLIGRYATRDEADALRKELVAKYNLEQPVLFERK
jgi:hypothetical protein